jgi:hypothetical protein
MHMEYYFDCLEHRSRRRVEYGFGILLSFTNLIIIIMNTYFPGPSSVLAFNFEADNDVAIRCRFMQACPNVAALGIRFLFLGMYSHINVSSQVLK